MKIRLVVLAAAIVAANVSAQEVESRDFNPGYEVAMERDLGISKAELPQFVNAENNAAAVEVLAKSALGDSYAGSWIEQTGKGQFSHVVASTDSSRKLARAGTEMRVVQYSLNQLESTMSALNDSLAEMYVNLGAGQSLSKSQLDTIRYMYVDVQTNSVVIKVSSETMKSAIDFVAVSKADIGMVRIEPTEGEPTPLVDIYGGREYRSGGGFCSIGFAIRRRSDNRRGFVTAGHCGGRGTNVGVGGANSVGSVQGASFPGDDLAWATVRQNSDNTLPFVTRYNGGSPRDFRIRGSQTAAIGAVVCRSGRTTGWRCGRIVSRNATVNYGTGPVRGLTQATACAGRGDSGGSWVSAGGQAQGVTSGGQLTNGNDNCGAGTPVTWFQPVNEILNRFNLRLQL